MLQDNQTLEIIKMYYKNIFFIYIMLENFYSVRDDESQIDTDSIKTSYYSCDPCPLQLLTSTEVEPQVDTFDIDRTEGSKTLSVDRAEHIGAFGSDRADWRSGTVGSDKIELNHQLFSPIIIREDYFPIVKPDPNIRYTRVYCTEKIYKMPNIVEQLGLSQVVRYVSSIHYKEHMDTLGELVLFAHDIANNMRV